MARRARRAAVQPRRRIHRDRGTRQDVDEQVRREEALRESDDRQREALHVARATIWTWDHQTKAVWRSSELYELLGLDASSPEHSDHLALRHPDDLAPTQRESEKAMRERRPYTIRYRMPKSDGTWNWVEERAPSTTRLARTSVTAGPRRT